MKILVEWQESRILLFLEVAWAYFEVDWPDISACYFFWGARAYSEFVGDINTKWFPY